MQSFADSLKRNFLQRFRREQSTAQRLGFLIFGRTEIDVAKVSSSFGAVTMTARLEESVLWLGPSGVVVSTISEIKLKVNREQ